MKERLFVGERRSQQAIDRGYSWEQGVSTAKFLFEALSAIGIDPNKQEFMNLWTDDGELQEVPEGKELVAMGIVVQRQLEAMGREYIGIVHPAARGKYKQRKVYQEHLSAKLKGGE